MQRFLVSKGFNIKGNYRSSCGGYEDGCTNFKLYMAQKIPASILFIIQRNRLKKNTRDLDIEPIIQSKF